MVHFGVTAQIRFVKVNGEIRQFTIYEPSGMTDSVTVPLLLNFHGQGMTSGEQMMYSKTNELADQNGFIVVYPQGINNDWNVGFEQDYDSGTNDVAFIILFETHIPVIVDTLWISNRIMIAVQMMWLLLKR